MKIDPSEFFGDIPTIGNDISIKIEWQWISVKEKLPNEKGWYLVYTKEKKIEILRFDGDINDAGVVTHWMSLPEAPKE